MESSRYNAVLGALNDQDDLSKTLHNASVVVLYVEILNHLEELGSVHIDSVRAVLDWIGLKQSSGRVSVCAGSNLDTQLAFHEFGYDNLLNEYSNIELVDINVLDRPVADVSIVLLTTHSNTNSTRKTKTVLDSMYGARSRYYSPNGCVWKSSNNNIYDKPDLFLVDALHTKHMNLWNKCEKLESGLVFASGSAEEIDEKMYDILRPSIEKVF